MTATLEDLLALGPTAIPGANLLLHTLAEGDTELLEQQLVEEREMAHALKHQLANDNASPAMLAAVADYIHELDAPEAERLQAVAERLYEIYCEHQAHSLRQGPTPFPQVNLVLHLATLAAADPAHGPALEDAVLALQEQTRDLVEQWEAVEASFHEEENEVPDLAEMLKDWAGYVADLATRPLDPTALQQGAHALAVAVDQCNLAQLMEAQDVGPCVGLA